MNEKKKKAYISECLISGSLAAQTGVYWLVSERSLFHGIIFGICAAGFMLLTGCFAYECRKNQKNP